jgi:hypothetical protein
MRVAIPSIIRIHIAARSVKFAGDTWPRIAVTKIRTTTASIRRTLVPCPRSSPPEPSVHALANTAAIATIEQFRAALLATRDWQGIAPMQLQMIQAQCRAPASTISPSQIAEQLHLKSASVARIHYGNFARAIAEQLGYFPPQHGKSAPCWWFTLSTARVSQDGASEAQIEWVMRPELVTALRAMNWA